MKVSKKAYYGLRAAVSLAASGQAVSAHELAEAEYIPEDFLEKILQKLRQVGIVESKKGVDGGYALARPTETISAWDILEALDGPIRSFAPPLKNTLPCSIISHCQTNEVWRILEKEIERTLTKITLGKLTAQENHKSKIPSSK
ncbi:MAG: Rrf2 family transcriptional regulator [Candidatus Moranbacteria bacterium]|nr:Rrf2 family transcriptional regulator [Candidatus Moranbacteria bacterium]